MSCTTFYVNKYVEKEKEVPKFVVHYIPVNDVNTCLASESQDPNTEEEIMASRESYADYWDVMIAIAEEKTSKDMHNSHMTQQMHNDK